MMIPFPKMIGLRPSPTIGWNILPTPFMLKYKYDCNLTQLCTSIGSDGFMFISYPIGGLQRHKYVFPPDASITGQITDIPKIYLPDLQFDLFLWKNYVTGICSPWIDTDSENGHRAKASMNGLREELRHAAYLGLKSVIIPVKRIEYKNLVKVIRHCLWIEGLELKVILLFPTTKSLLLGHEKLKDTDIFNHWINIRQSVKNYTSEKLAVGLKIFGTNMEEEFCYPNKFQRWHGEPLDLMAFPSDIWDDPTSSPIAQALIGELYVSAQEQQFLAIPNKNVDTQGKKKYCKNFYNNFKRNY
jgi:hypothetical protein